MKQEQYIEPIGFKGTAGEWKVTNDGMISRQGIDIRTISIWSKDQCLNIAYLNEQNKKDAQLLSQSKELAKALQEIIENAAPVPDYPGEYFLHKLSLENAKQALKEAGLTDK